MRAVFLLQAILLWQRTTFFFTYTMKFRRGVYRVLVRRPGGRLTRSLENNIKMDVQDVVWAGMDWIELNNLYCSNGED